MQEYLTQTFSVQRNTDAIRTVELTSADESNAMIAVSVSVSLCKIAKSY